MYGKRLPKSVHQTVISYAFTSSYSCEIEMMVCVLQLHWSDTQKLTWTFPLQPEQILPEQTLPGFPLSGASPTSHDSLRAPPLTRHPLAQGTVSLLVLTHPLGAFPSVCGPVDHALFWMCIYSCHSPDVAFDHCLPLRQVHSLPSKPHPVPGYSWAPDVPFHTSTLLAKLFPWKEGHLPSSYQACFPGGSDGNQISLQCGRAGFHPWAGKTLQRREWLPTSIFLPTEFHGQRSPAGYIPWGRKESDISERLTLSSFKIHLSCPFSTRPSSAFLHLEVSFISTTTSRSPLHNSPQLGISLPLNSLSRWFLASSSHSGKDEKVSQWM